MADDVQLLEPSAAPSGYSLSRTAAKQVGGANGAKYQRIVPTFEKAGAQVDVGPDNGLPVQIADGALVGLGTLADAPATAANVAGTRTALSLLKAVAAWALTPLVALKASEEHIGQIGGDTTVAVGSFARPADTTAYQLGDLIANAVAPGSVIPVELVVARKAGGTGRASRARLQRSKPEGATFRIHLFRAPPTVQAASGDNLPMLTDGSANYIGAFDVTTGNFFSDGAKGFGVPVTGSFIAFETVAGSQKLHAILEARGAVTPASAETFTITLEVDRD